MTEHPIELTEARDLLGHIVMAAAYGERRYVVRRYGKEIAFIGGVGELALAREREGENLAQKAMEAPNPPPPPDPLDVLRQMHRRGEDLPWPRTPEEWKVHHALAAEIGEKLLREAEAKA
jgi:hypothetical protein